MQNEITFGRKGVICAISPTFVFPSNDEVYKSMQSADEHDWIPPLEFTRYSGMKINISGSGSGTAANIEATKLDGVYIRSKAALEHFYSAKAEAEDAAGGGNYTSVLNTSIKFVPKNQQALKDKSAAYIASQLDYNSCIAIANNLSCTGKFAAANTRQRDALYMAAALQSFKQAASPEFVKAYINDPVTTMSGINQNDPIYQWVSYLESNYPGIIYECGSQETDDSVSKESVVIYDCPMKTPNIHSVDSQGLTKVYAFRIVIDTNRQNPVHVEIHEGKGRPQPSRAVGIISGSYVKGCDKTFDFTADEWLYALNHCREIRQAVITCDWLRINALAQQQRELSIQNTNARKGKGQAPTQRATQQYQQPQMYQQNPQVPQGQVYQQAPTQVYQYPAQQTA